MSPQVVSQKSVGFEYKGQNEQSPGITDLWQAESRTSAYFDSKGGLKRPSLGVVLPFLPFSPLAIPPMPDLHLSPKPIAATRPQAAAPSHHQICTWTKPNGPSPPSPGARPTSQPSQPPRPHRKPSTITPSDLHLDGNRTQPPRPTSQPNQPPRPDGNPQRHHTIGSAPGRKPNATPPTDISAQPTTTSTPQAAAPSHHRICTWTKTERNPLMAEICRRSRTPLDILDYLRHPPQPPAALAVLERPGVFLHNLVDVINHFRPCLRLLLTSSGSTNSSLFLLCFWSQLPLRRSTSLSSS